MNALFLLLKQPWAVRLGWTLLHFLWQGTIIAAIYAGARATLARSLTARSRYALACLALLAMALCPALTYLLLDQNHMAARLTRLSWKQVPAGAWEQALPWLAVCWLLGVTFSSVRLIRAWRITARLKSVGSAAPPADWEEKLAHFIRRIGIAKSVQLLISDLVDVPTVIGWLRPVILMPASALTGLPMAQVEALLVHELAHIRRHDYLINLLQNVVEALLFYHPAVWWISSQIRAEREQCCDDLAVAISGDVLVYVTALAELESARRPGLALAANGGSLLQRVRRLMGHPERPYSLPAPGAAWAIGLLWLAGVGAATLYSSPADHLRRFELPHREGTTVPAQASLLAPAPALKSTAPILTAFFFDPFFDPPQAAASNTPAPAAGSPPAKIKVEGTVLSATGEPVKRPSVRLELVGVPCCQSPFAYSETGDDAGKFVIDDVAPGSYTLTATKMGFGAGKYGARSANSPGATITLTPASSLPSLEIRLQPQATVAGRATNQDGDPAKRASITLYRVAYVRGRKQFQGTARAQTNDRGDFTAANLTPGRYYLSVQPTGPTPELDPGMSDITTYFPNSVDLAGAAPFDVAAGQKVEGMNVRLRRERVYSAKGKLVLNGAVVKDSILQLLPAGGLPVMGGVIRLAGVREGEFNVTNLLPGSYVLQALPGGAAFDGRDNLLGLSGRLEFTVKDSDISGAALNVGPGVELTGRFRLEDGGDWSNLFAQTQPNAAPQTPQAQSSASASTPQPPVYRPSIRLQDPQAGAFSNPMKTNDDGTFKLLPVATGNYLLDIYGVPKGSYVKAVHYGNQDVTRTPMYLVPGGGSLEVIVSTKAASVTGALHNDKGEAMYGIMVTVWPKNPNPGSASGGIQTVYTDQNGSFTVGGLEPGDYYAVAWDDIDLGLAQYPDFLARFTGQAASIKLSEGQQASAEVKLVPKDTIAAELAKLP